MEDSEFKKLFSRSCTKYGIIPQFEYQGVPVLSADIVDDQGSSVQIWVEQNQEEVVLRIWDKKNRSFSADVDRGSFSSVFDLVMVEYKGWLGLNQHTRTPILKQK